MKSLLCLGLSLLPAVALGQQAGEQEERYFPQRLTARDLTYTCAASAMTRLGGERRKYCYGFVSGVEEAMRLSRTLQSGHDKPALCVSADVTAAQLADIVVRYAARAGTDLTKPAALVVVEALGEAFPCEH